MIGLPRLHRRVVDSTNERAKALAAAGAPHGTLVTCDEQTAGRGRQGRSWQAPPGTALLCSLLIRDTTRGGTPLPLAVAVAVCEACEALGAREVAIKWPNDVWIAGAKVAGILVEGRPQEAWAVIGVGLNVTAAPDELGATATSLRVASGRESTPADALAALLATLDARLAEPCELGLGAWRSRDALLGSTVRWAGGSGTAAGVSSAGDLLVDTPDGRTELAAGEVHLEATRSR